MDLEIFVTEGLGDNSYLLASGDEALLVDPQRDAWRFLAVAEARKLTVRYVLETHVHNDYLSGALEVRAATGAEIVAPAKGTYGFPHRAVAEGDELRLGDLRLRVMETPGHTPEHVAYLVYRGGAATPVALFSGGSLLVGSVGRSDLLGPELTEELARAQFRSFRRLAALPDAVQVLPTHGAGSFCTTVAPAAARTSTLGEERERNAALRAPDEQGFLEEHLHGLGAYPRYYRYLASINRAGPSVFGRLPALASLSPDDVEQYQAQGAWVVDGRDRRQFAEAHVPGSVNIELDASFASYVGWVVPFNAPLVLVLPEPVHEAWQEAGTQLFRIGYERVLGHLAGGIEAWRASGRPLASYPVADVEELCRASLQGLDIRVLDVRQAREWNEGHIPGSLHLFLGDLPERADSLPRDRELWVTCASGYRSAIAASLLDRAGVPIRLVATGGVPEWLARCSPQVHRP
jgi:hydroxyacylglutathione hydrolase